MIGKVEVLLMRPLQRGPARRITTLHAFALTAGPAPVAADSLSCYIVAPAPECPLADLTPINLRDANQQFSELVRRVEATGKGYLVLRHGKPVARLLPASETPPRLTPEQKGALARLLSTS